MKKKITPTYIQRRDGRNLETVDEFDAWEKAREMLREYQMSDPAAAYYLSGRACEGWKDTLVCCPYASFTGHTLPTDPGILREELKRLSRNQTPSRKAACDEVQKALGVMA